MITNSDSVMVCVSADVAAVEVILCGSVTSRSAVDV